MQIRPPKISGHERTQTDAAGAEVRSPAPGDPAENLASVVDASLFHSGRAGEQERESDGDDTARMPNITRMPDGYEVVEQRVGRAVGQWVLQVRCQCGRRWFEVEAIEATTCPRCGLLVYLDVMERGR